MTEQSFTYTIGTGNSHKTREIKAKNERGAKMKLSRIYCKAIYIELYDEKGRLIARRTPWWYGKWQ